jgi:quinol-cytochrome oxidoreductase complex cytochrome b subunit
VTWLWGGFSVDNPTLNRFFSLHYLLPFVIFGVVMLHIWALHVPARTTRLGVEVKGPQDTLPFHPYYTVKDLSRCGVPGDLFAVRLLCAELPGPPGQLHRGRPAGDAGAHRA